MRARASIRIGSSFIVDLAATLLDGARRCNRAWAHDGRESGEADKKFHVKGDAPAHRFGTIAVLGI
jgi:hypothetical protein